MLVATTTTTVISGCAQHVVASVPRHQRRRAFSVAGPIGWNSLPDELRDDPILMTVASGDH